MQRGQQSKVGHTRNNTPTFLRFKRKSNPKIEAQEPHAATDRSKSRTSKASIEQYEKRILNLSKLKKQLQLKAKESSLEPRKKKEGLEVTSRRSSLTKQQENKINKLTTRRSGSNKALQVVSRQKGQRTSNSKRNQESLQKQQQRAKVQNKQLLANVMQQQMAPNYMKALKLKKMQQKQKQKQIQAKKRFLRVDIQMKGQQQLKNYNIYQQLGKGAYGVVKMGISLLTNQKVAIKIYQKRRLDEPNKIKNLQRQINILAKLNHPVIARLIVAIDATNQIFIIQEYGGANSLYNYLLSKPQHRMEETQAKMFFKTIAETLKYLHQRNIVHRDIKAQNILLNRHRHLKLIDFGFSLQSIPPATIDTFCGTPTYMAPQIVSKRDHVPIYTDLWSLGVFFFVILQGNYPFRAKNESELFQKIRKGQFEYMHKDISIKSRQVIQRLVRVNPLERMTTEDMDEKFWDWFLGEERKEQATSVTYNTTHTN